MVLNITLSVFSVLFSTEMSFLTQLTKKRWSTLEAAASSVLPFAPQCNTSVTSVYQWVKSLWRGHVFVPEEGEAAERRRGEETQSLLLSWW